MKTLYAVPWYNCNLLCPHCNISKRKVEFNKDKFIKSLKDSNYDNVILFGGEPTLNWNNFTEIISTGKINSVSTNLVVYSSVFMSLAVAPFLKENSISVATSWNLKRFKDSAQFRKWICNLKILIKEDIDVVVLITLSEQVDKLVS